MQKIARWIEEKKIAQIIFWIAYSIELAIMLIDKSALTNPWEGRLFQVTFGLFVIKILLTKYEKREWVAIALFTILGVVSYYYTDRNTILRIVAFVVAGKGVDIKKLIKYTFWVTLAAVIALMLLSATGVLGWNYVEAEFDGRGPQGVIRRYCFGLGHPNAFQCMLMALILLYVYSYWEKINIVRIIVIMALNVGFFLFTKSRTGVVVISVVVILLILVKWKKESLSSALMRYLMIGSVVLFNIYSVVAAKFGWSLSIIEFFDRFVTDRFGVAAAIGGVDTWSLFSRVSNAEYFDAGFIRVAYWYGIVPYAIYVVVLCALLLFCLKERDDKACIIVFSLALYTLFEAHIVSVYMARDYILLILMLYWPCMCTGFNNLLLRKRADATRQEA